MQSSLRPTTFPVWEVNRKQELLHLSTVVSAGRSSSVAIRLGNEAKATHQHKGGVQVEGKAQLRWVQAGCRPRLRANVCAGGIVVVHSNAACHGSIQGMAHKAARLCPGIPPGSSVQRHVHGDPKGVRPILRGGQGFCAEDPQKHLRTETSGQGLERLLGRKTQDDRIRAKPHRPMYLHQGTDPLRLVH